MDDILGHYFNQGWYIVNWTQKTKIHSHVNRKDGFLSLGVDVRNSTINEWYRLIGL